MKKSILLIILLITGSVIFAQTSKRTSAYNYLRNGKLDKAKEYIDPTLTHEKTMGDAKTWYYHGNIYLQIALSDVPEYRALDPNALDVAYASYVKATELDTKSEFKADIDNNMRVIAHAIQQYTIDNNIASNSACTLYNGTILPATDIRDPELYVPNYLQCPEAGATYAGTVNNSNLNVTCPVSVAGRSHGTFGALD